MLKATYVIEAPPVKRFQHLRTPGSAESSRSDLVGFHPGCHNPRQSDGFVEWPSNCCFGKSWNYSAERDHPYLPVEFFGCGAFSFERVIDPTPSGRKRAFRCFLSASNKSFAGLPSLAKEEYCLWSIE